MDDCAEKIARMVRFHRKKAGLTQLELSRLASIGKTAVFENGNYRTTELNKAVELIGLF